MHPKAPNIILFGNFFYNISADIMHGYINSNKLTCNVPIETKEDKTHTLKKWHHDGV